MLSIGAIFVFLNWAVFPINYITSAGLPAEMQIPITAFFTLTEVMIVFMLIRGNFS